MSVYAMFISFALVFVTELGDKTQLLMISFANKTTPFRILLGVALGSFFSHGIAILFGSSLNLFDSYIIKDTLKIFTYLSFILIGLYSFLPKKILLSMKESKKESFISKLSNMKINYTLIVALSIIIGELGDKTFLASIGLGIQYPNLKFSLIIGAILGMVLCDAIAIFFGKFLSKHISEDAMKKLSGILFIIFGIVGFVF
jgi:putative Ca2+/H+ antiporter (TMEM165/GDT1 family)